MLRLVFGGILALFATFNETFGYVRMLDWIQRNAPSAFAVLNSPLFRPTVIVAALVFSATGLYDRMKSRKQSTTTPASKETVKIEPIRKPAKPNLKYVNCRNGFFVLGHWRDGLRDARLLDSDDDASCYGVALAFENEPTDGQNVVDAIDVVATVVFKRSGSEVDRVHHAVWLSSAGRHQNIPIGETRELVIMAHSSLRDPSDCTLVALEDNRDGHYFDEPADWIGHKLLRQVDGVDVRLTEQRRQAAYKFSFGVSCKDGKVSVTLKPPTLPG